MNETAVTEDTNTAFLTPERVRAALAAPMPETYAGASTIGGFLAAVLSGVWFDGTGFDVGSPLGNGAWRSDIYHALTAAGLTPYSPVSQTTGPADPAAKAQADALIVAAIHQICQPKPEPGPLTARMGAVAKALDDSGEKMGAALVTFIANAMDLTDLGRAIAAEADELKAQSGQPVYVPPQDLRDRLGDFFALMELHDPRGIAGKLLASIPGEAFGPKETTRRRLTEALASVTVEVLPMLADVTRTTPACGRITDPAWLAGLLADALGTPDPSVLKEPAELRDTERAR